VVVAAIAIIIAAAVAIPKLAKHPANTGDEATETSAAPEAKSKPEARSAEAERAAAIRQGAAQTTSPDSDTSYVPQDTVKHYSGSAETTHAAKTEPVSPPSSNLDETSTTQGVVRQVLPNVSRGALNTISGKVRVKLKVHVNSAGDVTNTEFVSRGPSGYFASHAQEAAQQWKFAPSQSEQAWNLQFDFRRSGTTVTPSMSR
jgi:TonB family protein